MTVSDTRQYNLKEILKMFNIDTDIESYGNGHINDTYLCDISPRYILQRINTNVFKKPDEVMKNIYNVTEHLKAKITEAGGDVKRETLNVVPTIDGKAYYKYDDDAYFRMYYFVEDTVSIDVTDDPVVLCNAGRAFGRFQCLLSDFPASTLYETIVDFHNTGVRIKQLEDAVSANPCGRVDEVKTELDFAKTYSKYAHCITDGIKSGDIPLRVTHNDTKLNNVLFDEKTLEGICVIDLDTVMPGSVLYDFGDALRFGASNCAEDETDQSKIWFDLEKFDAFSKGFLNEVGKQLTTREVELLPLSALILTYECGIRFLADYINGDTYFKIHREKHNLDRARNQFALVADIESKLDEMKKIVKKYI